MAKKLKKIKKISQEEVVKTQRRINGKLTNTKWHHSFSIRLARKHSGRKHIYRLPNGVYVWRK